MKSHLLTVTLQPVFLASSTYKHCDSKPAAPPQSHLVLLTFGLRVLWSMPRTPSYDGDAGARQGGSQSHDAAKSPFAPVSYANYRQHPNRPWFMTS